MSSFYLEIVFDYCYCVMTTTRQLCVNWSYQIGNECMEELIREIQVEKVSEKIVSQIEGLIRDGRLQPGAQLPSERQLTTMFGVGRSSLREALKKLETMGYLEILKRKGVFVKSMDATLQLDPLRTILRQDQKKIMQLYEIRSDIEESTASAAAGQRNEQDMVDLKLCLDESFSQEDSCFSWELDQKFHSTIARASHNLFRIHAVLNILEFSKEFIQPILEEFAGKGNNGQLILQQHQAIVDAIEAGNSQTARALMKEHLDWTNHRLVNYFRSKENVSTYQ